MSLDLEFVTRETAVSGPAEIETSWGEFFQGATCEIFKTTHKKIYKICLSSEILSNINDAISIVRASPEDRQRPNGWKVANVPAGLVRAVNSLGVVLLPELAHHIDIPKDLVPVENSPNFFSQVHWDLLRNGGAVVYDPDSSVDAMGRGVAPVFLDFPFSLSGHPLLGKTLSDLKEIGTPLTALGLLEGDVCMFGQYQPHFAALVKDLELEEAESSLFGDYSGAHIVDLSGSVRPYKASAK